MDAWGSQSLNQPKNIHGLGLGLPTHVEQMCSTAFLRVPNNWIRGYLKIFSLYMVYAPVAVLPCLAKVTEEGPSSQGLEIPGQGGNTQRGCHPLIGEGAAYWGRIFDGDSEQV